MNDVLNPPKQNLPPICPFTIQAGEISSVATLDGKPAQTRVNMVPCIGPRCMAHATFTDENGKAVGYGCARLATIQTMDRMAHALDQFLFMYKASVEAAGVKFESPKPPTAQ